MFKYVYESLDDRGLQLAVELHMILVQWYIALTKKLMKSSKGFVNFMKSFVKDFQVILTKDL